MAADIVIVLTHGEEKASIHRRIGELSEVMSATSSDAGPTSPPFTANARAPQMHAAERS